MMFGKRTGLATALAVGAAAQNSVDPCRLAATQQSDALESATLAYNNDLLFVPIGAKAAYDCATSVPLNTTDAVAMISAIRQFLVFQTTLVFNANPPDSYQQPAIDVEARLDRLSSEVEDGLYENQYDFDIALQSIIVGVHDGHFSLSTGVYGLFSWILPDSIVSVSSDGEEIPKVFAFSDVYLGLEGDDISPIIEIEGENVFTYLEGYVNRTFVPGYIEPHAEWNHLAWSPATELNMLHQFGFAISRGLNNFQQTRVYNGESLSGKFANGTSFEWPYRAGSMMQLDFQGYTSGEIILREYVQIQTNNGLQGRSLRSAYERKDTFPPNSPYDDPAQLLRHKTSSGSTSGGGNFTFRSPGYPENPDVTMRNWGQGGYVSGYILDDISVGVLSIPSFATSGGQLNDPGSGLAFSEAVRNFIQTAKDADVKKIIIDLSANTGGTVLQGIDTFKQFFPDAEPPMNTRGGASPDHNTLGRLVTTVIENSALFDAVPDNVMGLGAFIALVPTNALDSNGEPWESYDDFFGPLEYNGGNFTEVTRFNLQTPAVAAVLNQNITGYGDNLPTYTQPWAAEDIIILHDGTCASTCTLFSDLIQNYGNVTTVAVGGVPGHSPMQGVAGTRGSNTVAFTFIDGIIQTVLSVGANEPELFSEVMEVTGLTEQDIDSLPAPLNQAPWAIRSGNVNTLDIVHPDSNEPGIPWQFAYEAAHCRIFFTAPMVRDITELWRAVAKFAEGDDSVCVRGSTEALGTAPYDSFTDSPGFSGADVWETANSTSVSDNSNGPEVNNADNDSNNSTSTDDSDNEGAASALPVSFGRLVIAFSAVLIISL